MLYLRGTISIGIALWFEALAECKNKVTVNYFSTGDKKCEAVSTLSDAVRAVNTLGFVN